MAWQYLLIYWLFMKLQYMHKKTFKKNAFVKNKQKFRIKKWLKTLFKQKLSNNYVLKVELYKRINWLNTFCVFANGFLSLLRAIKEHVGTCHTMLQVHEHDRFFALWLENISLLLKKDLYLQDEKKNMLQTYSQEKPYKIPFIWDRPVPFSGDI